MKTITFYSYKGGVGRTLALVNIANRLAEFGKKVCVMDFDLEAPGLNHKYKDDIATPVEKGLVDYIHEFAVNDILPDSIGEYTVEVRNAKQNNIRFIPAGNSEKGEYWKKLSRISWWDLFYQDKSEGIPFFLDLKEKIKKEFNPDYLLIDTRTGITEISAITMSILADKIVLLAVNNEENIHGTQHTIETIIRKENNLLDTNREIHFVLTRIPLPETPEGRSREYEIKNLVERKIKEAFNDSDKELKSLNVIHSDRETELYDKVKMGYSFENRNSKNIVSTISSEYLLLFDSIVGNDFSPEEKERFDNLKHAEQLLQRAHDSSLNNTPELLKLLDEVERLAPELPEIYLLRGRYYDAQYEYELALESFNKGISFGDSLGQCLFFRSESYFYLKKYPEALTDLNEYIDKNYKEYRLTAFCNRIMVKEFLGIKEEELISETSLLIEKYPYYALFYNLRSNFYRLIQQYDAALKDIYKAIDLTPCEGVYYSTLAEIKFCQGDRQEFYRNFDMALQMNYDIRLILFDTESCKNIYKHIMQEPEFIRILDKYNQSYFIDLLKKDMNKNQ